MSSAREIGQLCRHFLADGDGLVALFKLYLDEGGTNDGPPVLTVAAYVARPSQWKLFTKEWNAVLKPTGIKCYHATDAQACQKAFKGWTDAQVAKLCSKLLPIIPRYARGLSVSMDMKAFRAALKGKEHLMSIIGTPYNACFHWLVMSLMDMADQASAKPKFALVHETNDMKQQAMEGFDWVKANSPWGNGNTLLSLSFADKDEFAPLQAADILAFEVNRRINNFDKNPRIPWLVLQADKLVTSQYYGESNMHQLIADLEKINSLYGDLEKLEEFFRGQLNERDRLKALNAELVEGLRGLCNIAECWETVDKRKNIQLEHSEAYQRAARLLARAEGK